MSGHRQSALLMHGLYEADRHWILAQLNADDQRILADHLAELKNLGIPADPALITETTSKAALIGPAPESQPSIETDPLQAASVAQIRALLADEPVWLVRHVLALENWTWRQEYLAGLGSGQRERLRIIGDPKLKTDGKLAEHLRAQLSRRLAGGDHLRLASPAPQAALDHFSSLKKAIRRWF